MSRSASRVRVVVSGSGPELARAVVADTPVSRSVGLLGRASLEPGDGLVLQPCGMIHTWFMRFPIDVLFLDRDGRVVRAAHAARPFRIVWGGWRAWTTIELPAGTAAGIAPGTRIDMEPVGVS